jgi:hypothetical protein
MVPFSLCCSRCGEYILKGRKFNARKETTEEKYFSISIYRFYIRCTRCSGEITFKTDPKNTDYQCESGAKRLHEPWKGSTKPAETEEETMDRLIQEESKILELEQRDKMQVMEERMMSSKVEMAVADALDEIQLRNARVERGERRSGGERTAPEKHTLAEEESAEREIDKAAKQAFRTAYGERVRRCFDPEDDDGDLLNEISKKPRVLPNSFFKRTRDGKKKDNQHSMLGIKKKVLLK